MEQIQTTQQPPEFNPQEQPFNPAIGRPMMPFWTAVKTCFKKYFDFKGRARRSEYWWFILFGFIVYFVWAFLTAFLLALGIEGLGRSDVMVGSPIMAFFTTSGIIMLPILFLVIPMYSALTRRLHDTGRSGWWVVASLALSIVYSVTYFYMFNQMISSSRNMMEGFSSPLMIVIVILALASMALGIALLVFSVMDSQPHENKYGPSPKYQ